jgi:hypothetical protein
MMTMSAAVTIHFDEARHRYFADGRPVPSVSTVIEVLGLADFSMVPARRLREKAEIGTFVHQATAYLDRGTLDWTSLHPLIRPYIEAYAQFKLEANWEPRQIEERSLACVNGLYYGMTPDRVGLLNGRPAVGDLKCTAGGEDPAWGVQLAGYALGLPEPAERPREYLRFVIHLSPEGKYKLYPQSKAKDFDVFRCGLFLTYWKLEQRLISL